MNNNLVLYRKYRPKTFKEIIGQEHIVKTLTNATSSGMISHAYLFSGPRGTGKTTLARLLAKSINCLNRKQGESEPCNKCDSCLEVNKGNAIDLIEIDAGTNTGIDDIRNLKEGIGFVPAKSKYKVFIIDECHQLSNAAVNALLKTLEEPPAHAIFVLATTEIHKMLSTILSRCQRFDFHLLKLPEIIKKMEYILKKEGIAFEKETLPLIAIAASGSLRDSESLLDQIISFAGQNNRITEEIVEKTLGIVSKSLIFKFLNIINEKKAKEAIETLNESLSKGVDIKEITVSLIHYLREILLLKIDPKFENDLFFALSEEEKQELQSLTNSFSEEHIKESLERLMTAEEKIKYASIPQLPLELAIVEICGKKE